MSYSNPVEQLYQQEELYNLGPRVVIIIPVLWNLLPDSEQLLLSKILTFVKKSLSTVQILTLTEAETDALLIFRPSHIIAFGSILKVSGMTIEPYQPHEVELAVVLQADSLDLLDDPKKKILGKVLREMFQL